MTKDFTYGKEALSQDIRYSMSLGIPYISYKYADSSHMDAISARYDWNVEPAVLKGLKI